MRARILAALGLLIPGCASLPLAGVSQGSRPVGAVDLYPARLQVALATGRHVQLLPDFWDQVDVSLDAPKLRATQTVSVATATTSLAVGFSAPPGPATVSVAIKSQGLVVATGMATASLVPGNNAVSISLNPLQNLVMTVAGQALSPGLIDGVGPEARFNGPEGLTIDGDGNLYVADTSNNAIRKIKPDGTVTTLAGNGTAGWSDQAGANARFNHPHDVAYDATHNWLYVADTDNQVIRRIDLATNAVTTPAGSASIQGSSDGTGGAARFNTPFGLCVDGQGNVYIADFYNQSIRRMTATGSVTKVAGTGSAGASDGLASLATFSGPRSVAVDGLGTLYVGDYFNHRIRMISVGGTVTTLAGSSAGYADGLGSLARFDEPGYMAFDPFGILYVGDVNNNTLRTVYSDGSVGSMFGTTAGYFNGVPGEAQFRNVTGIAIQGDRFYMSDTMNHCIRLYHRPPTS